MADFQKDDPVKVRGKSGTVTEVAEQPDGTTVYSVRLDPWKKVGDRYEDPEKPGEFRDHEADVLGGLRESELEDEDDGQDEDDDGRP